MNLTGALRGARANTDALLDLVHPDAVYERPLRERHRIIFYLGHLEAFDWNLVRGALGFEPFHPSFDRLFAFGIDPGAAGLPADTPEDWPRVEEVRGYNRRVRETLDEHVSRVPEQLLHVAIEHRLMHAETFAYMLHGLTAAQKQVPPEEAGVEGREAAPRLIEVPAGRARLGREESEGFGWDNEFAAHEVDVPAFAAGRYKVTNREYLRYVEAGAAAPHFWVRRGGAWCWRGMFEEPALPLDWPVYVTWEEAAGYARFAGGRLPTEAEYHRCREQAEAPSPERDNFDFLRWDPVAVNAAGEDAPGFQQVVGNGWEWTSTPFAPFAGFQPFSFYPGYSANFFDGEHYVLKGASPRTASRLARASFRNWFRAGYPHVYATLRVVAA